MKLDASSIDFEYVYSAVGRHAAREAPRDARLPGVEDRIGAGGLIVEAGRVGDLQTVCAVSTATRRRAIGLLDDAQIRALGPDVFELDQTASA